MGVGWGGILEKSNLNIGKNLSFSISGVGGGGDFGKVQFEHGKKI